MAPTLAPDDELIVSPSAPDRLVKGDIILVCRGADWIAHRFIERETINGCDCLVAGGDFTGIPDAPVPASDLVGHVMAAEREGRRLALSPAPRRPGAAPSRADVDRLLFRIACLDGVATPDAAGALAMEVERGPGWDRFVRSAVAEGLAELAWVGLRTPFRLGLVPARHMSALELEHATTLARNSLFLSQMAAVAQALKGLDWIPLKGAYLASEIYSQPGLRRFGDIDILIHREDMANAIRRLALAGYRVPPDAMESLSAPESGWLNSVSCPPSQPGPALHLHWHLFNSILPKYGHAHMDMNEMWRFARPLRQGAMQLDPAHVLMHLAEHAFRHSFDRLILLRDQAEMIRKRGDLIDWDRLIADARRFGLDRSVFFSFRLLQAFSGDIVPPAIVAKLAPQCMVFFERAFLRLALSGVRRSELCNLAYLGGIPTVSGRLRYLFGLLFPPREVLARAYGRTQGDIRISDYFRRICRGLRQVMSSSTLP